MTFFEFANDIQIAFVSVLIDMEYLTLKIMEIPQTF